MTLLEAKVLARDLSLQYPGRAVWIHKDPATQFNIRFDKALPVGFACGREEVFVGGTAITGTIGEYTYGVFIPSIELRKSLSVVGYNQVCNYFKE